MPLRVTLVQAGLRWRDPAGNRSNFDAMLETLAPGATDVVVLPEMFSTGFDMDPAAPAESPDGPTLQWMRGWAQRLDAAVTGSVMTRDGDWRFNRLWFVAPDGAASSYDKRHLFRMAGEHRHYAAGTTGLVVAFRGWRIAPLVCYDLRFPVWSRRRPGYDYELLLYVANWPARRAYAWRQLLIARAIENQSYVVGVNRIGADGNGVAHDGDSAALDFLGMPLASLGQREDPATVTLQEAALAEFRERFPAHLDADRFELLPPEADR
ncbi:MAG: amidohydrolase [Steroidobacteraceae bacterium]|jgi:predicted amidohydrolase|nr:amidohydrolase [Steroidobacteraceae bacterium]